MEKGNAVVGATAVTGLVDQAVDVVVGVGRDTATAMKDAVIDRSTGAVVDSAAERAARRRGAGADDEDAQT